MKHILRMKFSKRIKLSYFQNFVSHTFLDNLSLEKKSRKQFTFLFTPGGGGVMFGSEGGLTNQRP